jgi:hypothetical protein
MRKRSDAIRTIMFMGVSALVLGWGWPARTGTDAGYGDRHDRGSSRFSVEVHRSSSVRQFMSR